MGTRLVKVRRRRPLGVKWAVVLLFAALVLYVIVSLPVINRMREATGYPAGITPTAQPAAAQSDERVVETVQFEALSLYMIQFGVFDDAETARIEGARYVRRGAAGYLLSGDKQRVIGAGYDTREEADKVAANLGASEDIPCEVREEGSPGALLRVTATGAQIAALRDAERVLREETHKIGYLAYSLDRGETDTSNALSQINASLARAKQAREALVAQAGDKPNAVASGLIELLNGFDEAVSQISNEKEQTALVFSSKIKYNFIDMRLNHITYLNRLTG